MNKANNQGISSDAGDLSQAARAMNMMAQAVEHANSRVAVPAPPVYDNTDSMYTINNFLICLNPMPRRYMGKNLDHGS